MYYTSLEYYLKLFDIREREYAYRANSKEEHALWKASLRNRLAEISGINKGIPCEPVHEYLRTDEMNGLRAEYHLLQTEPGIQMPYYLIRPDEEKKPHPVIIIPHGHGGGKEAVIDYQTNFINECLEEGFIVICPDERGSGDRREFVEQGDEADQRRSNSHRELLQVGICFGRTVIGTAVWDLMRLTDYIQTLPEASDFIACAGMSGGGQQTLWFSAMDDRIKAVITSGYFYGVKESLIELPHNCACNFVPHFFETCDMGELGALIAPRPFLVESGEKDGLNGKNGIANVLSQLEITKKAYALFDEPNYPVHKIHPGGHQWVGNGMREFLKEAIKG